MDAAARLFHDGGAEEIKGAGRPGMDNLSNELYDLNGTLSFLCKVNDWCTKAGAGAGVQWFDESAVLAGAFGAKAANSAAASAVLRSMPISPSGRKPFSSAVYVT